MMRALWLFVLILMVATPQRVCTCQHEHHAHVPVAPADPVDDASCVTTDSDQDCHCQCKSRIGDAPKRVAIQLDDFVSFVPPITARDNDLSVSESCAVVRQDHIAPPVPLYLSTARLRP
jgi:hypothetical protein